MRFSFEPGDGSISVYDPPAIVVQAFDIEQAYADIQSAMHDRDEAKGEFKDAILRIGQKLIEARRAMPGEMNRNGCENYSPAFLAFIERCGLTKNTARNYMVFARDPRRLVAQRANVARHDKTRARRTTLLREVLELLLCAPTLEAAINAIDEELNETR